MKILVIALASLITLTVSAAPQNASETQEVQTFALAATPVVVVHTPTTTTSTTTTTTTTVPEPEWHCPQWRDTAITNGWSEQDWPRVDYIIWRESRCLADAYGSQDPNGGSHSLMQINGFWCRPSSNHPQGWLQEQGIVQACDDLYVPEINFRAARAIYEYSLTSNKCGWLPWTTRNTRWCS